MKTVDNFCTCVFVCARVYYGRIIGQTQTFSNVTFSSNMGLFQRQLVLIPYPMATLRLFIYSLYIIIIILKRDS